ncbi:MAG: signal peptidase I [archaeon]
MEKILRIITIIVVVVLLTNIVVGLISGLNESERISPSDTITEGQIRVYDDRVVIYMDNPYLAEYTNSNSMDPVLDEGANGLLIIPKEEDLNLGDIVSYQSEHNENLIVHRIVEIGNDDLGTFYRMKGDNNSSVDFEKVRFEQIKYKTLGIIY